jgi:hypothetical protein
MLVVQNPSRPAAIRHAIADILHDDTDDLKVAAAYVTTSGTGLLLDVLTRRLGARRVDVIPKALVTSFDFGLTDPAALEAWAAMPSATVRVAGGAAVRRGSLRPSVAFHPKLYLFGYSAAHSAGLVGSSNLTGRGLSINTEAGWSSPDLARAASEAAFALASEGTEPLTPELLKAYRALRVAQPPPPQLAREVEPVPLNAVPQLGTLPIFVDAVDAGLVVPGDFEQMWVQVEKLQGGSGNQLELPRAGQRFFGFYFTGYASKAKVTIGTPVLRAGNKRWTDRLLTWHGNNRMERMNLPTLTQGGFVYDDTAVMFRRLANGEFELIIAGWDSDLARSWREASAASGEIFKAGKNTNRLVGLI